MRSRPLGLLLLLACVLAGPARSAEPERRALSIAVRGQSCSALLLRPADARVLLVLAHGQIMSIDHPFMEGISSALARNGVATLRFNFPYAEAKRAKPDPPRLLVEAIEAAVQEGERLRGTLPLFVGGKSMGALATAQAASDGRLGGARGLVILSYPLHAPSRPSAVNARALEGVKQPILFVQGTRDELADLKLVTALAERLGKNAKLYPVEGADHSFAVVDGRSQDEVYEEMAHAIAVFVATLPPSKGG